MFASDIAISNISVFFAQSSVNHRTIPLVTPPGGDAFADAFVFAVEMLGPPSKARRHFVAVTLVHALRDIAQEGVVVGLQGHVFIGLDNSGGGLAFRDSEVVVAGHEAPGQAAEEDPQLEVRIFAAFGMSRYSLDSQSSMSRWSFFPRAMQA